MFSPILSRLVFIVTFGFSTRFLLKLGCRFSDGFIAVSCNFVSLRLLAIVNCVALLSSVSLIVCFSDGAASSWVPFSFSLSAFLLVLFWPVDVRRGLFADSPVLNS